jgi:hypothetical protein
MSRSVIVKWFFGSLIGLAGGLILLFGAGVLALGTDVLVMDGPDVVGIRSTASAWTLASLLGLATLVFVGSGVAMFVAWIGAVLDTASLADKTWFIVLLVVGLLGMVFFATIAYVAAGPVGLRPALNAPVSPPEQRSGREVSASGTNGQHVGV